MNFMNYTLSSLLLTKYGLIAKLNNARASWNKWNATLDHMANKVTPHDNTQWTSLYEFPFFFIMEHDKWNLTWKQFTKQNRKTKKEES